MINHTGVGHSYHYTTDEVHADGNPCRGLWKEIIVPQTSYHVHSLKYDFLLSIENSH